MDLDRLVSETRKLRDAEQAELDGLEARRRELVERVRGTNQWLARFDPEATPSNGSKPKTKRKLKDVRAETKATVLTALLDDGSDEGLTVPDLAERTGLSQATCRNAVEVMRVPPYEHVYIAGHRKPGGSGTHPALYKPTKGAQNAAFLTDH